ncbi:hypothetical protein BX600DRAFT_447456 [Xylariales sp. PMI_506]|nr:hypothetical protein BX600DRAFT_447456 [Xylariales sp. PMI_506]
MNPVGLTADKANVIPPLPLSTRWGSIPHAHSRRWWNLPNHPQFNPPAVSGRAASDPGCGLP